MWLAMLAMGLLGGLVIAYSYPLAVFFLGNEPLTIEYTVQFIYILGSMMPLLAVDFAIGGALRGAGDTRFPLVATFLGLIGVRCGLAALATFMMLPVFWVYAALVGDYLLKASLLIWRFRSGRWRTVVRTEDMGIQHA
jgi:Na+-driven multidrug efflux pump